jgi:hypothetical protein
VVKKRLFLGNKNHANGSFEDHFVDIHVSLLTMWLADLDTLRQLNITHIINISRDTCKPYENEGITYHQCYIADSVSDPAFISFSFDHAVPISILSTDSILRQVTSDVSVFFEETTKFIQEALQSHHDNAILVNTAVEFNLRIFTLLYNCIFL